MALWQSIPGETPIDDISGLRIRGITTRRELSEAEAANINRAVLKYLASQPSRRSARFDLGWSLKLHQEMFGDVWDWAGEIRARDGYTIGVPFHQIQVRLSELLKDAEVWSTTGMEWVEQSARLHHQAVLIHPFQNGNGRWARMLGNIWLKLHEQEIVHWPEKTIEEVSSIRDRYIAAIQAADRHDVESLVALHREYQALHG